MPTEWKLGEAISTLDTQISWEELKMALSNCFTNASIQDEIEELGVIFIDIGDDVKYGIALGDSGINGVTNSDFISVWPKRNFFRSAEMKLKAVEIASELSLHILKENAKINDGYYFMNSTTQAEEGPYSAEEIQKMISNGKINLDNNLKKGFSNGTFKPLRFFAEFNIDLKDFY